MSFWKLVAAIVVGNLLTGVVAVILWTLVIASVFSSSFDAPAELVPAAKADDVPTERLDVRASAAQEDRKLSAPDANGCIKELAEAAGGRC